MTLKSKAISFVFIIIFMAAGFLLAVSVGQNSEENADKLTDGTSYYTLNYDANGGENAPTYEEVNSDGSFVISTTKPKKDGYTFLGWSCEKDATEAMYQSGSSAYLSGNTTIYAVWSK